MKICKRGIHQYPDDHKCCLACNRIKTKEYHLKNKDQIRGQERAWRNVNKEHYKATKRAYNIANPAVIAAKSAKRRAVKLNATPKWLSKEQLEEIKEFYLLAKELQWLSDPTDPLEVDHIVPLQGKEVSGLHVPWNLQILPRGLNRKKGHDYEI